MRFLRIAGFVVLVVNLMSGQSSTQRPGADSGAPNIVEELNRLNNAITTQQKQITEQQQAIAQQQREIETLRQQLATQQKASTDAANAPLQMVDAALHASANPAASHAPEATPGAQQTERPAQSPLSFRIGGADFTPGGFVDFENVFRTTNSGSVVSTNFGNIPFSNVPQGHLSEFRTTAQYSRFSLKVSEKFGANDVTGYMEMDFNGNDATNVFASTNGHTDRLRVYWMDMKRGKWQFMGGQMFGWTTPNRVGVGPAPADLMTTTNEDGNIQVGLPYTRSGQFRVAYHPNDHWALGVGIENPQQFIGAGQVTFPTVFNTVLTGQFDANGGGSGPTTPNLAPDVVSKIAYDTDFGKRHLHLEGMGLLTSAKVSVTPVGGTTVVSHSKMGGGGQVATVFDLFKNFRLVANAFWSYGGGRYINGLGADAVVAPNAAGTDVAVSLIHSGGGISGFEFQAGPKTLIAGYYGIDYFQRNFFRDTTSPAVTKPFIGFGGPNSANSANRSIQEPTLDITQTLWKNPQYGALLLINQASYLTRSPWFVAPNAPKNAHLFMDYVSLRYVLP